MKPILAHVHIYYPHLYKDIKECLLNITTHKIDLFVTMVEEHSEVISDIKATFPNARIEIVENKGFDIAPFIHVINKVNLDDYDLVVKLHTKRDIYSRPHMINGYDLGGSKWRNYLLNFCKTEENWKKSLNLLNRDDVSMVSDYHVILKQDANVAPEYLDELENKLKISYSKEREFVAGTMFVAKAKIFKPLQNKLKSEEFSSSVRNTGDDLPYACERVFGFINDSKIVSFDEKKGVLERYIELILRFICTRKITDKKETIKIFKIPVYKKVKIKDIS